MTKLDFFQPEKRESTVEYVINTIKDLLITRKLKPGDMLPSETALAESLNVSRGSIREAMKILSAFGVVEIRRGHGTYIAEPSNKSNIDPFLFNLILSRADAPEMAELRELLESQIVTLVIKKATDEDLAKLEQVHNNLKQLCFNETKNNAQDLVEHELKFHRTLGQATGNVLIEKIYNFVMEFFKPYVEKTYNYPENCKNAVELHENIVMAIKQRDREKALDAIQKSIEEWRLLFNENH